MSNCTNSDSNRRCYFQVLNYGRFIVRFYGTYELRGRCHNFSSGNFGTGEERRVNIPSCATNINFIIQVSVLPFIWTNVCEENYNNCGRRCFLTYGLIFNPFCTEVPCNFSRLSKSILPSGVFIPINSCEQSDSNNYNDFWNNCSSKDCNNNWNNYYTNNNDNLNDNYYNSCGPSYDNYDSNDNNCPYEEYNNSDPYEDNYYSNNNGCNNYCNNRFY